MTPPPMPEPSPTKFLPRWEHVIIASIARRPDRRLPPRRGPNDRVSCLGRRGLSLLPRRRRAPRPVCRTGAPRRPDPALLPAADPAADRLYGVLLAAGGRLDRAVYRHGVGLAVLYRVQPVQRRGRGR